VIAATLISAGAALVGVGGAVAVAVVGSRNSRITDDVSITAGRENNKATI
jgi:hypothetical protein